MIWAELDTEKARARKMQFCFAGALHLWQPPLPGGSTIHLQAAERELISSLSVIYWQRGKKQRRMLSSSNSHSKRILRFTLLFSLPYHLRGVDSHSRGGKVRKTYPATTAPLPRLLLCGSSPVGRWRGNINDEVPTWEMPVYLTLKNM